MRIPPSLAEGLSSFVFFPLFGQVTKALLRPTQCEPGTMYPQGHSNALVQATQHEPPIRSMAQDLQPPSHLTHQHTNFPPSLPFETSGGADSSSTSLSDILEGLPMAVRSSLGPLRTIRQSVSIRGWVSYFYETSNGSTTSAVAHEEHTESRHTLVSTGTAGVEMQQHQQMNSSQKRTRAASTHALTGPRPYGQGSPPDAVEGSGSRGPSTIDWFCGTQGQSLVSNALAGSRSAEIDENGRRAYVQGVVWLLRALPQDLNSRERLELETAMHPATRRRLQEARHADATRQRRDRSLIHHVVAQLVIPLQFLWACLLALLFRAIQLERKHRITEHVIRCSGELGYTMGKGSLRLSEVIYRNGGARVGATVAGLASYVADEVVKGISDGIRESRLKSQEYDYR